MSRMVNSVQQRIYKLLVNNVFIEICCDWHTKYTFFPPCKEIHFRPLQQRSDTDLAICAFYYVVQQTQSWKKILCHTHRRPNSNLNTMIESNMFQSYPSVEHDQLCTKYIMLARYTLSLLLIKIVRMLSCFIYLIQGANLQIL